MVYGTQNDRFQWKNWFLKICTEFQDIGQNVQHFTDLVWRSEFGHILDNTSGLGAYFSKPIFALNPINWTNFFFTYIGSFRILKRKSTKLKFWFFFFWLILVLYIIFNTIIIHISTFKNVIFSIFQPTIMNMYWLQLRTKN